MVDWVEDREQVPDPGVDVGGDALEGGVPALLGIVGSRRVGNAPVPPSRVVAQLWQRLAGPVAQGDHVVEPAFRQGAEVSRPLTAQVDAVLLVQDPHGVGMQDGPRSGARTRHGDPVARAMPQQRLGDG